MVPSKVEFDLGRNVYGQPVTLARANDAYGKASWQLRRGQADQRDDTATVCGLTSEQILAMAEAVRTCPQP